MGVVPLTLTGKMRAGRLTTSGPDCVETTARSVAGPKHKQDAERDRVQSVVCSTAISEAAAGDGTRAFDFARFRRSWPRRREACCLACSA